MDDPSAGRSAFGFEHHTYAGGRGSSMRALAAESARELDELAGRFEHRLEANPNIVAEDTHLNESFVNDGNGGLRPMSSLDEYMAYRKSRNDKVFRKMTPGKTITDTTFVTFLPRTLCHEVPAVTSDGRKITRWVANDVDEANRYFADAIEFLTGQILPSKDCLHYYSSNFDEGQPHIQGSFDSFLTDEKHEGRLKVGASEIFFTGKTQKMPNGEKPPKKVSGPVKLMRYQEGFRAAMRAKGWPVEKDASERSKEGRTKEQYVTEELLKEEQAKLVKERAALDRELDELPRVRAAAKARGWEEGRKEGMEAAEKAARVAVEKELAEIRRQTELNNAAAAEHLKRARELEEKREKELRLTNQSQEIADQTLIRLTNVSEVGQAALLSEISNVTGVPTENLRLKLDEVAATSDELRTEFEGLFNRRAEQLAPKRPSGPSQPSFGPAVPEKSHDGAARRPGRF